MREVYLGALEALSEDSNLLEWTMGDQLDYLMSDVNSMSNSRHYAEIYTNTLNAIKTGQIYAAQKFHK